MSRRRVNDAKDIVIMSDRMVDAKEETTMGYNCQEPSGVVIIIVIIGATRSALRC